MGFLWFRKAVTVESDPVASPHLTLTNNPHSVTAAQVGAEPADAALQAHLIDTSDPHSMTWAQVDKVTSDIADITTKSHTSLSDVGSNAHSVIDTHIGSSANPHSVTAAQASAEPANANIQSHISDTADPHSVTWAQLDKGTSELSDLSTIPIPANPGDDGKHLEVNAGVYTWEAPAGGVEGDPLSIHLDGANGFDGVAAIAIKIDDDAAFPDLEIHGSDLTANGTMGDVTIRSGASGGFTSTKTPAIYFKGAASAGTMKDIAKIQRSLGLVLDSNDGNAQLRHEGGTLKGYVSTTSQVFSLNNGNARFTGNILSTNTAGTDQDGTYDIGANGKRYKDLHLSGIANAIAVTLENGADRLISVDQAATTLAGDALTLQGGNALDSNQDGGSVVIKPGAKHGSGEDGSMKFTFPSGQGNFRINEAVNNTTKNVEFVSETSNADSQWAWYGNGTAANHNYFLIYSDGHTTSNDRITVGWNKNGVAGGAGWQCQGSTTSNMIVGNSASTLLFGSAGIDANQSIDLAAGKVLQVNSIQVVGTQAAAIADASAVGAGYVQAEVQEIADQLNDLLAKLRTHGLIAT